MRVSKSWRGKETVKDRERKRERDRENTNTCQVTFEQMVKFRCSTTGTKDGSLML